MQRITEMNMNKISEVQLKEALLMAYEAGYKNATKRFDGIGKSFEKFSNSINEFMGIYSPQPQQSYDENPIGPSSFLLDNNYSYDDYNYYGMRYPKEKCINFSEAVNFEIMREKNKTIETLCAETIYNLYTSSIGLNLSGIEHVRLEVNYTNPDWLHNRETIITAILDMCPNKGDEKELLLNENDYNKFIELIYNIIESTIHDKGEKYFLFNNMEDYIIEEKSCGGNIYKIFDTRVLDIIFRIYDMPVGISIHYINSVFNVNLSPVPKRIYEICITTFNSVFNDK